MFYSARHSLALTRTYFETFGARVPEPIGLAAAKAGRMQELMQVVDEAISSGAPVTDWSSFETPSRASSMQTAPALA